MLKEMEPKAPGVVLMGEKEVEVKRRWLQMGAELEGSWAKTRKSVAAAVRGSKAIDDRSVHIGHGDPGEIVTRPHDVLEDLCRDITELWPDTVNDSCGFHIHASFTPMDTSLLATREFYVYFKERWNKWGVENKIDRTHEFWTRLAGRNKFATDRFDPETQLRGTGGAPPGDKRYTMLNFYAWEKHRTVECRLLPMFNNLELALSAVRCMSDIYNVYLSRTAFVPLTFEPKVQVVGDVVEENYVVVQPATDPQSWASEGYFRPIPTGEDIFYSIPGAEHQMQPFQSVISVITP